MNAQPDNIQREAAFCDLLIERLNERISNGEPTAVSAALRVQAQRLKILGLAEGVGAEALYDWKRLSDSELETLRALLKKAIVDARPGDGGGVFDFDFDEDEG